MSPPKKKLSQKELAARYLKIREYERQYAKRPDVREKRNLEMKARYHAMRSAHLASLKKDKP